MCAKRNVPLSVLGYAPFITVFSILINLRSTPSLKNLTLRVGRKIEFSRKMNIRYFMAKSMHMDEMSPVPEYVQSLTNERITELFVLYALWS